MPHPRLSIRQAAVDDVPAIAELLRACVADMQAAGIEQWDDIYPTEAIIRADISAGSMYIGQLDADTLAGVIVLNDRQDPQYADVPWTIDGSRVGVVHRLMVNPTFRGQGHAGTLMLFIEQRALDLGYDAIRLDAFTQNPRALRLYQGLRYHDAGSMTLRKGIFRGFEKSLRDLGG